MLRPFHYWRYSLCGLHLYHFLVGSDAFPFCWNFTATNGNLRTKLIQTCIKVNAGSIDDKPMSPHYRSCELVCGICETRFISVGCDVGLRVRWSWCFFVALSNIRARLGHRRCRTSVRPSVCLSQASTTWRQIWCSWDHAVFTNGQSSDSSFDANSHTLAPTELLATASNKKHGVGNNWDFRPIKVDCQSAKNIGRGLGIFGPLGGRPTAKGRLCVWNPYLPSWKISRRSVSPSPRFT